jgi:hypothetical protein
MWRGESPQHRRDEVADLRRGRDFLRAWSRHGHVELLTFLEQELSSPHHRLGVETVPHYPIVQDIRNRDQLHALVM